MRNHIDLHCVTWRTFINRLTHPVLLPRFHRISSPSVYPKVGSYPNFKHLDCVCCSHSLWSPHRSSWALLSLALWVSMILVRFVSTWHAHSRWLWSTEHIHKSLLCWTDICLVSRSCYCELCSLWNSSSKVVVHISVHFHQVDTSESNGWEYIGLYWMLAEGFLMCLYTHPTNHE